MTTHIRIGDHHRYARHDIWREGQWLDLWSAVHFLTGISIGLGMPFLRFGAAATVTVVLISLIAYEMWEKIVGIEETASNRFMDVVVGMVSFLPTYFLVVPHLTTSELFVAFGLVLTANVILSVVGWRASQKAIELEKRMRIRYIHERARLLEQKARLRKRFRRRAILKSAGHHDERGHS